MTSRAARLSAVCSLALFLGGGVVAAARDDGPSDREKRALDRDTIKLIRGLVPPSGTASAFLKALTPLDIRERRDIGFGATRVIAARHGGHATCWITLISVRDAVASLRVDCFDAPPTERIEDLVRDAWGRDAAPIPGGARYERTDAPLMAEIRKAMHAQIGAFQPEVLPPQLVAAWNTLNDPFGRFTVGGACDDGASARAARAAIDALFDARQVALLRGLLRSLNLEARVAAADALLRLREEGTRLNAADVYAISVIRSQAGPVRVCRGGAPLEQPAAAILADPR